MNEKDSIRRGRDSLLWVQEAKKTSIESQEKLMFKKERWGSVGG